MTTVLIDAHDISLKRNDKIILDHISITIDAGEIVTLVGPNGAGKTTLVKVLTGLIQPDAGKITSKPGLTTAYVPQQLLIDSSMPMLVSAFLSINTSQKDVTLDDKLSALALVSAEHLLDKQSHSLSGGELRRVLLARAIMRQADLLVLDEPTTGVDINGQAQLYRLLTRIRDNTGCGILLISHDLHMVMSATDKVVCLNQHVCCQGKPDDINAHPEYLSLLEGHGELTIYNHHHNHQHNLDGNICGDEQSTDCDDHNHQHPKHP